MMTMASDCVQMIKQIHHLSFDNIQRYKQYFDA